MTSRSRRLVSALSAGLLLLGGFAVSAPATAAVKNGSRSCSSSQMPSLKTTRAVTTSPLSTVHTWTGGDQTRVKSSYSLTFESNYWPNSSGSYSASTAASTLTVDSITCTAKPV